MELRGEVKRFAKDARLVLEVGGIDANSRQSWVDVGLEVSVTSASFSGSSTTSVSSDALKKFADELAVLDEKRTGTARLQSMSPGEFDLSLVVTHPEGHIAALGRVATSRVGTDKRLTNAVAFEFEVDLDCVHAFALAIRDLHRRLAE